MRTLSWWRKLCWGLRVLVAALLLTWLARSFGLERIARVLEKAHPGWILAGAAAAAVQPFVCTAVQWLIVRRGGNPVSYLRLLRIGLVGIFLNTFFIGRFLHDAYFIASLRKILSVFHSVSALVSDYAFNMLALVVWTLPLALANTGWIAANRDTALTLGLVLAMIASVYALAAGTSLPFLVLKRLPGSPAREEAAKAQALLRPGGTSLAGIGLYLVRNLLLCSLYYCFFKSVGASPAIPHLLFIVPLVGFIALLPVTVSGLGVREASLVWLFQGHGTTPEQCVAVGLMVFAVWQLIKLLGGLALLARSLRRESFRGGMTS